MSQEQGFGTLKKCAGTMRAVIQAGYQENMGAAAIGAGVQTGDYGDTRRPHSGTRPYCMRTIAQQGAGGQLFEKLPTRS